MKGFGTIKLRQIIKWKGDCGGVACSYSSCWSINAPEVLIKVMREIGYCILLRETSSEVLFPHNATFIHKNTQYLYNKLKTTSFWGDVKK